MVASGQVGTACIKGVPFVPGMSCEGAFCIETYKAGGFVSKRIQTGAGHIAMRFGAGGDTSGIRPDVFMCTTG
jgi:hypothetical protein